MLQENVYFHNNYVENIPRINLAVKHLRSFGHQGALYYAFLASDSLKTSREYAVFTLRTRGPKSVHTQNLASNAKSKCVFVLIAPNDRITSCIAG